MLVKALAYHFFASGKVLYKRYEGTGDTENLSWDGLKDGLPVPEGKYNVIVKSMAKFSGERLKSRVKVGVDMSPPEITYITKTATGKLKNKIRIVLKDPQTGIRVSETKVENRVDVLNMGLPQIDPRLFKHERLQVIVNKLKSLDS